MKKIMIAAAAIALATCSQAAMVYWQFGEAAADNASKGWTYFTDSQDLSGYTAYLISAGDWDTSDVAGSLAKAQDSLAASSWTSHSYDTTKKQASWATGTKKATGLDLTEGTGNFYIVLADDNNYWASSELKGVSVLADGSIETGYTVAKVQLATTTVIKPSDLSPIGGGDVPEPTSGLLLLLGMAGLALRRKQA